MPHGKSNTLSAFITLQGESKERDVGACVPEHTELLIVILHSQG